MALFKKIKSASIPEKVSACPECGGRLICTDVVDGDVVIECCDENIRSHTGDQEAWIKTYKKCAEWANENIRIDT